MKNFPVRPIVALLLCGVMAAPVYASEPTRVVVTKNGIQGASVTVKEPRTSIEWNELDSLIREGSLRALALDENILSIEAIDYNQVKNDLLKAMNEINNARSELSALSKIQDTSLSGMAALSLSSSIMEQSLDSSYDSLKEAYDDVKDGKMEKDNKDLIRQLENAKTQIVTAGENLYIAIVSMEDGMSDGYRGLSQLDMHIQELRLRQKLGQVTEQDVMKLENTRRETEEQLHILDITIRTYKSQLQALIGEQPTGEIQLGLLPEITDADIADIDYDADLKAAKEASWTMREAKINTNNAGDDWDDTQDEYEDYQYQYEVGEHTWKAAHINYDATEQEFELAFKQLYDTVIQKQLAIKSKEKSLEYYDKQLKITELKLDRGMADYMDYVDAMNDRTTAESALKSAQRDLLTAYNNYDNAAAYGILS